MRVLIFGAGAMGGTLAALLARAGHDVAVVDKSEAVVEAINGTGLTVTLPDGEILKGGVTAHREAPRGGADIVFVFVKGTATEAVAGVLADLEKPSLGVVTLQNGWGSADTLAGVVGDDRLVIGVTYNSAMVIAPGEVNHTKSGPTFVGPYERSGPPDLPQKVATLLSDAGLQTTVSEDAGTEIWKKLVLNAAVLPVSALTGLRGSQIAEQQNARVVVDLLAAETVAVAQAFGFQVDMTERIETIYRNIGASGMGKNSMLSDVEAQRRTEIDLITGAVVREGLRLGVATPISATMWDLVRALESGWKN